MIDDRRVGRERYRGQYRLVSVTRYCQRRRGHGYIAGGDRVVPNRSCTTTSRGGGLSLLLLLSVLEVALGVSVTTMYVALLGRIDVCRWRGEGPLRTGGLGDWPVGRL